MAAPGPRLFLEFDTNIQSNRISGTNNRFLYKPRKAVKDIAALASLIAEDFAIPASQKLRLCVNGYTAPAQGPASLLRDNDIVTVAPAPILATAEWRSTLETAIRGALAGGTLQTALTQMLAAAGQLPPEGHQLAIAGAAAKPAGTQLAKSRQEPGAMEQPSKPKKKRERLEAAEEAAAPDKPAASAKKKKRGGGPDDTSDDVSDSEGEAGDAGKGPSRSARRKKLKRQLRRQGLLDTGLKQKSSQDRGAAAAVRDWREMAPLPPQELPKRGDEWARSRTEVQFMKEGHVYFTDSDGEDDKARGSRRVSQQVQQQVNLGQSQRKLPGPPPRVQPSTAPDEAPLANGQLPPNGLRHQQKANGHQEHTAVRVQVDRPGKAVDTGPKTNAEFQALQKAEPYPIEGDIIAYRVLHISADWTPQVSEWRKGRVIDLDEQNKVLTVEPWPDSSVHPVLGPRQPSPTGHESWSDLDAMQPEEMGGASDEYEEELPPSDYNEDGILVTALASFSDIRLIRGRAPAAEQGAHPDRPESVRPATEGAPSGASALPASNGASAAEVSRQSTSNLHSHAAAENGHSGLANGLPNLGPPKPGGAAVPSIGNWAELAAQLKKRREELAAQQSAVAASLPASSAGIPVRSGSNGREPPQQPSTGDSVDKLRDSVAEAVSEKEPDGRPDDKQSGGAVDAAAQTPTQLFGSGVGMPGASKPRPGVRSSAIGPLLARLRREATDTEG